jgi:uncharacterized membrane protein
MTAFIIVALTAILLVFLVGLWIGLHHKYRRHRESFAGQSTISELKAKDRREN